MSYFWKLDQPLLLASSSATRLQLLRAVYIPVECRPPDVDERALEARLLGRSLTPDFIALELASAKGAQVSGLFPDRLIVAADQTLALGAEQFHKPGDTGQARAQLQRLSGKTHSLHSGVVCFRNGQRLFAHVESAHLKMRELGSTFLDAYLAAAGDTVTMSVGAYQLEGLGAHLFERVEGDHSTILGLPLLPLLAYFRTAGVLEA